MDKTQPPPTTPFVGRTEELALLQQTWDEVAAGEPRFLVWTADTGLGKTRLVQAFYEWLSTERHARDPHGYWPDALSISGRTLAVNPAFPASDGPRPDIPWLWWGLRFTDSKYERGIAASTCGLSNAREHLEPHLEPVIRARYGRELAASLAKANAGIWGGLLTGGLSGALFDGLGIFELNRKRRRLDAPLPGIATQQAEHWRDTVEEMLALFRAALGSGIPLAGAAGQTGKRPIPCALILDDAQWADVDTLRFIEPLFVDALRQPLAMASYQGSRFLDDLLLETARRLDEPCSEQDLARARDPHAIVERVIPPALPPAASSSSAPGTRSRPKSWRRSTRTLMRPTPSAQPCVQSSPTGAPRAAWPHLTPATASSR
ncbi:AAA family ATPase [uncultured Thiohalocapsa sp.]|uniref:AAA family ATPase n=1 Tax=uncultured Thiohalocapsa sp. TaxID=768990 RepID=UPI0025F52460|nr:AAA family ATPase [uncultured Thiohalocapsa sp.]